jgi:hypothetical protein
MGGRAFRGRADDPIDAPDAIQDLGFQSLASLDAS